MNRPMRICMVSDDYLPSKTGVGVHLRHTCEELTSRGYQISVITSRRPGQPASESVGGMHVFRMFSIWANGFRIAVPGRGAIRKVLNEAKPDILHYHYAGMLCRRTRDVAEGRNCAHLYTYHMTVDHLVQNSPILRPFAGRMARAIRSFCNRCDMVTAPASRLAEQVRAEGVNRPVVYIPSACGIERLPRPEVADTDGRFRVLYVGRLNPEKNVSLLLEGFAELYRENGDCELILVGDGPLRRQLEQQAHTLGIGAATRFTGWLKQDDLPKEYARSDVFVLPSRVETLGMSAIEAMYYGKPIIATHSIVSASDLVRDGVNGYLVSADCHTDLAQRLRQLCAEPQLRASMVAESRQHFAQFTTSRVVDSFVQQYRVMRGLPIEVQDELHAA